MFCCCAGACWLFVVGPFVLVIDGVSAGVSVCVVRLHHGAGIVVGAHVAVSTAVKYQISNQFMCMDSPVIHVLLLQLGSGVVSFIKPQKKSQKLLSQTANCAL